MAPVLPGISDRPEQLREVVKAAREAGATGVWTNLLFLRPGTREHFLEHLAAEDWPEHLPLYRGCTRAAPILEPNTQAGPRTVAQLARRHGIPDRRPAPLNGERDRSSSPSPFSHGLRRGKPANWLGERADAGAAPRLESGWTN